MPREDVELIEQKRRQGGEGHHGEVPVLDMADLMRQDCVRLLRRQRFDQPGGDHDACIGRHMAERKGIGRVAVYQPDTRDLQPTLSAKLLDELPVPGW